jgi:hypothetical protein
VCRDKVLANGFVKGCYATSPQVLPYKLVHSLAESSKGRIVPVAVLNTVIETLEKLKQLLH